MPSGEPPSGSNAILGVVANSASRKTSAKLETYFTQHKDLPATLGGGEAPSRGEGRGRVGLADLCAGQILAVWG
ncbi:hypothetical protein NBRC116594_12170 [Shimia sp. NS0008-38b]